MNFYVNELSLHAQFGDDKDFIESLKNVRACRRIVIRFGFTCFVRIALSERDISHNRTFRSFLNQTPNRDLKREVLGWIDKGPFWETQAHHPDSEYFECCVDGSDILATESSLAEAAFSQYESGDSRPVISFIPSSFSEKNIVMTWHKSVTETPKVPLTNICSENELTSFLEQHAPALTCWSDLIKWTTLACPNLSLVSYILEPLQRQPFMSSVATKIQELLRILNKLNETMTDENGISPEGMEILKSHFSPYAKGNPDFTDESKDNIDTFQSELTFRLPDGRDQLCSWHGKVTTAQYRVHFNWPKIAKEPLYIVYIGPKLTKK